MPVWWTWKAGLSQVCFGYVYHVQRVKRIFKGAIICKDSTYVVVSMVFGKLLLSHLL